MGVPAIQRYRIGLYILKQRMLGRRRYPLVLMLEPLFKCNLNCAGCGKIDYPQEVFSRRLGVEECLLSVKECGAPVVSVAGGEPLLHEDMPEIVKGIIRQKRFVYLCTNGLLLRKNMHSYSPSDYLTFSIHLDGNRERHDASVSRPGVFDVAVDTIKTAISRGFRVTVNCTLYDGVTPVEAADFFDFVMALGIEGITVSPGFNYEHAPQQEVFLKRMASKRLFREIFKLSKGRSWRFNQTTLYLDFLAGNQTYQCTPWGTPTRNIFGWQRPCYLLQDGEYAPSFKALLDETDWSMFGLGRNPRCSNCMLHSGFEATAVSDMFSHPFKAMGVALSGPKITGPMAPDLAVDGGKTVPETDIKGIKEACRTREA